MEPIPYTPGDRMIKGSLYAYGGETWQAMVNRTKGTVPKENSYWDYIGRAPVTDYAAIIAALTNEKEELMAKQNTLSKDLTALQSKVSTLQATVDKHVATINDQAVTIQEQLAQVNNLKAEQATLKLALTAKESEVAQLQQKIKELTPEAPVTPPPAPAPTTLTTIILDYALLKANKTKTTTAFSTAKSRLSGLATTYLSNPLYTITDKPVAPPGGTKNDYWSMATYWWPNPNTSNGLPYIRKDGHVNPEIDRMKDHDYVLDMCREVQTWGLAYFYSGNEAFVKKAVEKIRRFFIAPATKMNPNAEFAQMIPGVSSGRGTGLIDLWPLVRVFDGLKLMEPSANYTAADREGMQAWASAFLSWMRTSDVGNEAYNAKQNIKTYYELLAVTLALFIGNTTLAKNRFDTIITPLINSQVDTTGKQPLELVRTKPWTYSVKNLQGLFYLAQVGEKLNIDLWSQPRLKLAYQWLLSHFNTTAPRLWGYGGGESLEPTPDPVKLISLARTASVVWPDIQTTAFLKKYDLDFSTGQNLDILSQSRTL